MLLCLSHCRSTIKKQIEKATGELEQLQKFREETASSPRDQRYMPTNMGEAQLIGALYVVTNLGNSVMRARLAKGTANVLGDCLRWR